jgi:hypothetical protein
MRGHGAFRALAHPTFITTRHCEEQSDEAIQNGAADCFATVSAQPISLTNSVFRDSDAKLHKPLQNSFDLFRRVFVGRQRRIELSISDGTSLSREAQNALDLRFERSLIDHHGLR